MKTGSSWSTAHSVHASSLFRTNSAHRSFGTSGRVRLTVLKPRRDTGDLARMACKQQIGSGLAGLALASLPLGVAAAELGMLSALTKGSWTLTLRDDSTQQRICLRDGRELVQIRHRQAG